MSIKKAKITDLKFDEKNFNKGTEIGDAFLGKSIEKFGFREAATLDKNGVLIGGNKRTAKAGEKGLENVEIIKADPNKVYALQYDDIDINTQQGRELALALNQTAKINIMLDAEMIEEELGEDVCEEWNIDNNKEDFIEDEDNIDKPKHGLFPLAIILTKADYSDWQTFKKGYGIKGDTDAFLKIFKEQTIKL